MKKLGFKCTNDLCKPLVTILFQPTFKKVYVSSHSWCDWTHITGNTVASTRADRTMYSFHEGVLELLFWSESCKNVFRFSIAWAVVFRTYRHLPSVHMNSLKIFFCIFRWTAQNKTYCYIDFCNIQLLLLHSLPIHSLNTNTTIVLNFFPAILVSASNLRDIR